MRQIKLLISKLRPDELLELRDYIESLLEVISQESMK